MVKKAKDEAEQVDEAVEAEQAEETPTAEPAPAPAPIPTPTEPMSWEAKRLRTKAILEAEPKVSYRIPLGFKEKKGATEVVVINGYSFVIKKGVRVEVPQSVALVLDERFDALENLGENAGVDGQDVRLEAAVERAGL